MATKKTTATKKTDNKSKKTISISRPVADWLMPRRSGGAVEQKKNTLRKIGALWVRSAKNTGNKYMSGVIDIDGENSQRLVVFKNGYKEETKHPDYIIYLQEDNDDRAQDTISDDDIPF